MIGALRKRLERVEIAARRKGRAIGGPPATRPHPLLRTLGADPGELMTRAGIHPDPWQRFLLSLTSPRVLLLCSRQSGKSTAAAALALREALLRADALVLLLSPTLRQSGELFRKVMELFGSLGRPVPVCQESALRLELVNGSRIISLPGTEGTVRGYSSARLLVIDEAARVKDDLYRAVRPMLAVSQGRFIGLSTPFGKFGWFHEEWFSAGPWQRIKVTAHECPRISREFLDEERQALGSRWFAMEYGCEFQDVVGQVFAEDDIQALFRGSDVAPLILQ